MPMLKELISHEIFLRNLIYGILTLKYTLEIPEHR
jgi:hypothetical protein